MLLVAHFTDIDAFPTSALELPGTQALVDYKPGHRREIPSVGLIRAITGLTTHSLGTPTVLAVDFIRTVHAVSDAITLPAAMDAAAVLTLKLVRSAGSGSYRGREWHGVKSAEVSLVDTWVRAEHATLTGK